MESSLEKTDSFVSYLNSRGTPGRGTLLHVTRNVIIFEVYNPYSIVQLSEVLRELKIVRGERTIYSGRAVVSNLIATGLMLIVSVTPVDSWSDLAGLTPEQGLKEEVSTFVKSWDAANRLRSGYQLAVSNMGNFLSDLALWLNQVQVVATVPDNPDVAQNREYVETVEYPLSPKFDELFAIFERESALISPEEAITHRAFCRRELHPLLLCSPFIHRSFTKPLGYAGDYEIVNMMLDVPLDGPSLYAKLVNWYFLKQGAPAAHRNRIDILIRHLKNEAQRVAASGRRLKIMNIGCGPAVEIQRFVREAEISEMCDFTLMDFNDETIAYAGRKINEACAASGHSPNVSFVHKSVDELLKEVAGLRGEQVREIYDYVYCAGLFDYLSDRTCKRLIQHFLNWTVPGGLVVTTNVHSSNPVRYSMEHIMEWYLIYRNEARMHSLSNGVGEIEVDPTGFNVFLGIRKPTADSAGGAKP